jgi:chemotaxis protein CheZ
MPELVDFSNRLQALARQCTDNDPEMVAAKVRSVLGKMRGELSLSEAALLAEIEDLASTLANARAEIAAMGADDITASHIPCASDELDAIVEHTAAATDSILECCEQMEAVVPRLAGDDSRLVQDSITRIYEACSFQDITGQRITKVVSVLQSIERKVGNMIAVFAPRGEAAARLAKPDDGAPELLNGPQLTANAMHQSDIDALLASFD